MEFRSSVRMGELDFHLRCISGEIHMQREQMVFVQFECLAELVPHLSGKDERWISQIAANYPGCH